MCDKINENSQKKFIYDTYDEGRYVPYIVECWSTAKSIRKMYKKSEKFEAKFHLTKSH